MRILILHKTALVAMLMVFIVMPFCVAGVTQVSGTKPDELPIYAVGTDEKKVAVTFNAAWGDEDVDVLLEALAKRNARCTFFLVGEWAEKFPDATRKIQAAGHETASHGYSHVHYNKLEEAGMAADLEKSEAAIENITGERPCLFRAPYGEYNKTLVKLCRETERYIIQWDVDSLDWQGLSGEEMQARILSRIQNGSIILFHTGTKQTASTIGNILDAIEDAGYSFSTVGDLIYREKYHINHEGRQLPDEKKTDFIDETGKN